jgi:hypothetical protein
MKTVVILVALSLISGCAKEIHEASAKRIGPTAEPLGSVLALKIDRAF